MRAHVHEERLVVDPPKQDPEVVIEVTPAKALKHIDEAWMRISLLDAKSAMKQTQFYAKEFAELEQDRNQARAQLARSGLVIDKLETRIASLEKQLESKSGVKAI